MDELIPPIVATPVYCGLKWNGYVCSYGMVNAANEACESHALRLIEKNKKFITIKTLFTKVSGQWQHMPPHRPKHYDGFQDYNRKLQQQY